MDEKDALRICDLMSLIDSAVLHERIFCLPASLPDDVQELELRNRLIESGALALLLKGEDHDLIGQAFVASLSTVTGLHEWTHGRTYDHGNRFSFEDFQPQIMNELGLTTDQVDTGRHVYSQRRRDEFRNYGISTTIAEAESFDEAAIDVMVMMDAWPSGGYTEAVDSLRAMYYVFASEHYGLPYLASAGVQSGQQRFPNYFHPSVREKLYQQLASALRATVDSVVQEFDGPIVFIPPFSALVLNRASTLEEIPSEMLALRTEYSDFRRKMRELEHDRLEARSLNDRLKVRREIERLGKEVVRPFNQVSQMKLELTLRYMPDAADVVTNPTNPAGWAKVLLGLPTEALINWYRRRPVAKLAHAAKVIGRLPDYDSLLTKHFGETLTAGALQIQSSLQES